MAKSITDKKVLALFDFDGTLTKKDTMFEFIRFSKGNLMLLIGLIISFPILVLYKLGFYSNEKAKEFFLSFFFKGSNIDDLFKIGKKFANARIEKILYKDAKKAIEWHKSNNHKIIVISASIDIWLSEWCKKNKIHLISTKLHVKNGKISGRLLTKNCFGPEKVNRLKKEFNLSKFSLIYAYGDSRGDKEMLSLADKGYYREFKK